MFSVELHEGYEEDIIHQGALAKNIFLGDAFKLEKDGPIFPIFRLCPSRPSVATERNRKQFQCLTVVLRNETGP